METINMPPLGLRPRFIVEELRVVEISQAMIRYYESETSIPYEWIEEYNELLVRCRNRRPPSIHELKLMTSEGVSISCTKI